MVFHHTKLLFAEVPLKGLSSKKNSPLQLLATATVTCDDTTLHHRHKYKLEKLCVKWLCSRSYVTQHMCSILWGNSNTAHILAFLFNSTFRKCCEAWASKFPFLHNVNDTVPPSEACLYSHIN